MFLCLIQMLFVFLSKLFSIFPILVCEKDRCVDDFFTIFMFHPNCCAYDFFMFFVFDPNVFVFDSNCFAFSQFRFVRKTVVWLMGAQGESDRMHGIT